MARRELGLEATITKLDKYAAELSRGAACWRCSRASAASTTDALLVAHGFAFDLMAGLVSERLATATPEHIFAAGKPVEVTRVRVTDPSGGRSLSDGSNRQKKSPA